MKTRVIQECKRCRRMLFCNARGYCTVCATRISEYGAEWAPMRPEARVLQGVQGAH